jgi:radical SAM superfamily enzyme YgiQ (UPF0313 family)
MKIQLIYPSGRKTCPDIAWWKQPKSHRYPGLGLTMVAALSPGEADVSIVDDDREEVDFKKKVDLVGISLLTSNARRGYDLARLYRARGIPVVLGGMHASSCPEEAQENADTVVIGEAEDTWPALVKDFAAGRLQKVYRSSNSSDLRNLPFPRRDLLVKEDYITINNVQATRGCPFDCEFCSIAALFGNKTRFRPIEEVLAEIESLGGTTFMFSDDNLAQGGNYFKELFRRLIPLKKRWVSCASWNIARDDETLDLLERSGCRGLAIGFESLQPQHDVKKIRPTEDMALLYKESVRKLHRRGISILGAFIFGFDNEDETVFKKTLQFAVESQIDAAQLNILVPFPGTRLRKRLEAEDRIIEKDWSKHMASNLCFKLKNMTPETFLEGYRWVKRKFHTIPRIVQRLAWASTRSGPLELSLLLGVNLGNRKAIKPV